MPAVNTVLFLLAPIDQPSRELEATSSLGALVKTKIFWLFIFIMVLSGACELGMSQWASAFAESALHVSKTIGDLAGPLAFATLMGTARALYGKYSEQIPLQKMMIASAFLCICCYLAAALSNNPIISLFGCAICGFAVGIF